MNDKRSKDQRQLELTFPAELSGEAGEPAPGGIVMFMAASEPEHPVKHDAVSCVTTQASNRRGTDPYARWCGRAGAARPPPIPIAANHALADRYWNYSPSEQTA